MSATVSENQPTSITLGTTLTLLVDSSGDPATFRVLDIFSSEGPGKTLFVDTSPSKSDGDAVSGSAMQIRSAELPLFGVPLVGCSRVLLAGSAAFTIQVRPRG